MNKKIIGILICILLVFATVLPVAGTMNKSKTSGETQGRIDPGNTLYVGGSGPENYSKIQDAINAASDGDTVFVFDDSSPYYEHVIVNRSIRLIGENRETVIIDGNLAGDIVNITVDGVTISGFTVKGSGDGNADAGLKILASYLTLSENIITECRSGIYSAGDMYVMRRGNIISGNIITNNRRSGFTLYQFTHSVITENIITNNSRNGISFQMSSPGEGSGNIISRNIISGNYNGIQSTSSIGIIITENTFANNRNCGIMFGSASLRCCIHHNNFVNNVENAYDAEGNIGNKWDNGYPSGGNYWSDYLGNDSDGDGIGDTPYLIPGNNSQDNYPLMNPWVHQPKTIYVDDDNIVGPWDGTLEHPYQNIQDGVNASLIDDTVFVFNGLYHEHVMVTGKMITLTGENALSTIIDGSGKKNVLYICTGSRILVSGFTFQNSGTTNEPYYPYDAGVHVVSDFNIVSGNIIRLNENGIYGDGSRGNTFTGNTITNNSRYGINLRRSPSVVGDTITKNTVTNNPTGIWMHINPGGHDHTVISENTIADNIDYGIQMNTALCYCTISENTFMNNGCGIFLNGWNNQLYHNNFLNNTKNAWADSYTHWFNSWDNGYPSGGNYWDNYTGIDNDGDGIGDTPYNISINNQDRYPLMHRFVLGDMNVDGMVNFGDINPFVLALTNPSLYQQQYHILPSLHGDINQDGQFNFGDINPFVALLSGG